MRRRVTIRGAQKPFRYVPVQRETGASAKGSKPEFAAFGSNGCCLPPKCYADLPRRSYRNITSAACRRGIIQTSALWMLCRGRHNIHATSHAGRLDRNQRFCRKADLAFEELCAEIGSAMLCVSLELVPDFAQSAAYVESWLRSLKNDKKFIFRAASDAQKAADYLLQVSSEQTIQHAA